MRYLVILDRDSAVGRMYAAAPDALLTQSNPAHPILDCTDADFTNPHLLKVTHSLARVGRSYQTLFIPYHAIVSMVRFDEKEEPSFPYEPKQG